MAVQLKKASGTNEDTFARLVATNAALNGAENATGAARVALPLMTRDFYIAVALHGAASPDFNGDDVIAMRVKGKVDKEGKPVPMPTGNTLKSRRRDWNSLLKAGRAATPLFRDHGNALWENVKGMRGMLRVCPVLAEKPDTPMATLKAIASESETTAGDYAKRGIEALAQCDGEEGSAFLDEIVEHYAAIVAIHDRFKREGKLLTGTEMKKKELGEAATTSRRVSPASAIAARLNASA